MSSTISPNMSLIIPTVGSEPGPTYADDLNASLTLIDNHDHSSGRGLQISPAGMNINANLSMANNSLINTGAIVFESNSVNATALSLYVSQGVESPATQDLWFTDGNGTEIQLTKSGTVNASIASLPGESYAGGTFSWVQGDASTTPANFDIGSVTIRPNTAGTTNGVVLGPPSAIASQYNVSLPLLPASQSLLTIDNAGVMLAPAVYPLPAAALASSSVSTAKIVDGAVTLVKLSAINIISSSFGTTNIPTSLSALWYEVPSAHNSVTITAGTWRLTGSANWTTTANAVGDLRIGWFGGNGGDSASTPSSLSVTAQLSGRRGEIRAGTSASGTNYLNFFVNAPETIVTVSGSTQVYLNLYHGAATGAGVQYQGTIAAEQLR